MFVYLKCSSIYIYRRNHIFSCPWFHWMYWNVRERAMKTKCERQKIDLKWIYLCALEVHVFSLSLRRSEGGKKRTPEYLEICRLIIVRFNWMWTQNVRVQSACWLPLLLLFFFYLPHLRPVTLLRHVVFFYRTQICFYQISHGIDIDKNISHECVPWLFHMI